jgi:hypothetical protein
MRMFKKPASGFIIKPQFKSLAIRKVTLLSAVLVYIGLFNNIYADADNDSVRLELTPYLWAATIKGTTATGGDSSPPVDSGYNFFSLDNLDGVASATFTAHNNQWGFLFDYLYVAYEDTFLATTPLQITPRLEGTIIELAGAYALQSIDNLEIVAGLRQQDITVSLTLLNRKPERSVSWIDPFAGIIYVYPINSNLRISMRGDLGGFGINSDIAVNAEAMLRYQMSKTFSIKFGYRYIKVKYDDSDFVYDISLDGFQLGVGILF